jgi:hypothetical protein
MSINLTDTYHYIQLLVLFSYRIAVSGYKILNQ